MRTLLGAVGVLLVAVAVVTLFHGGRTTRTESQESGGSAAYSSRLTVSCASLWDEWTGGSPADGAAFRVPSGHTVQTGPFDCGNRTGPEEAIFFGSLVAGGVVLLGTAVLGRRRSQASPSGTPA